MQATTFLVQMKGPPEVIRPTIGGDISSLFGKAPASSISPTNRAAAIFSSEKTDDKNIAKVGDRDPPIKKISSPSKYFGSNSNSAADIFAAGPAQSKPSLGEGIPPRSVTAHTMPVRGFSGPVFPPTSTSDKALAETFFTKASAPSVVSVAPTVNDLPTLPGVRRQVVPPPPEAFPPVLTHKPVLQKPIIAAPPSMSSPSVSNGSIPTAWGGQVKLGQTAGSVKPVTDSVPEASSAAAVKPNLSNSFEVPKVIPTTVKIVGGVPRPSSINVPTTFNYNGDGSPSKAASAPLPTTYLRSAPISSQASRECGRPTGCPIFCFGFGGKVACKFQFASNHR